MSAITIRIDHDLSFDLGSVSAEALYEIKKQFRYKNPAYAKAQKMGYAALNEPKEYQLFEITKSRISLRRGTVTRLKKLLIDHDHEVEFDDRRLVLEKTGLTLGTLKPLDYQVPAIKDLLKNQQGILRGHTGAGKTETMLAAIVLSQQPFLVQVWNKDLMKQWVERIVKYGILPENEIGIVGGGKDRYGLITIGMIQSLYKRIPKYVNKFGGVAIDECQRSPARTFLEAATPFPAKYRWGASADEKRKDGKHFLLYETVGYRDWTIKKDRVNFKPVSEIEGRGQSMEPTVIIVPTTYEDTVYEEDRNHGQLINRLVADEGRNRLIAKLLKKQLKDGRQIILFTDRVEAAIMWADLVSSWGYEAGAAIGGSEHAEATTQHIDRAKQGLCKFLSSTSYAEVGLDVPCLDTAFITCPTSKNIKRMLQIIGRIVRPLKGKKDPVAFYFWDFNVSGISKGITAVKRKWKKHIVLGE